MPFLRTHPSPQGVSSQDLISPWVPSSRFGNHLLHIAQIGFSSTSSSCVFGVSSKSAVVLCFVPRLCLLPASVLGSGPNVVNLVGNTDHLTNRLLESFDRVLHNVPDCLWFLILKLCVGLCSVILGVVDFGCGYEVMRILLPVFLHWWM